MRGAWWVLAALLLTTPAEAKPAQNDQLQRTQEKLERSTEEAKALEKKRAALGGELEGLRKELVKLATKTDAAEHSVLEAEKKLALLEKTSEEKESALRERRASLQAMLSAAVRLSRTPPEAMLLMPKETSEAMQSARVLSLLIEAMQRETKAIREDISALAILRRETDASQARVAKEQAALEAEQRAMEVRIQKRQLLAKSLLKDQATMQKRIAELSRQAKDLKGLVGAITNEADKMAEAAKPERTKASGKLRSFAAAKGRITLPAAGNVMRRFGDALDRNASSKGMVLKTRSSAKVRAPYDGEVVFTGPFLDYGPMVILRHKDDFHTLLAGLGKVEVAVGEFLLEGEPIGAMNDAPYGPKLYVELRHRNQPVDPAPWIAGLSR